jgi:hypothetical protein
MAKIHSNVNVVEMNLSRSDFTLHGLHVNASGKEKMAVFLGQNIKALKAKHDKSLVLQWVETQIDLNQGEAENLISEKESLNREVRLSKRVKRNPVNRNNDFLWMI